MQSYIVRPLPTEETDVEAEKESSALKRSTAFLEGPNLNARLK